MGRPKSILDHKLAGTYRADRHGGRADAKCVPGAPLDDDDKGEFSDYEKEILDAIMASLPAEVFCTCDATVLSAACTWGAQIRHISDDLRSPKRIYPRYRLLIELALATKNFLAAASKLGLSPVDRARLQVPDVPMVDAVHRKFLGVQTRNRAAEGQVRA